MREARDVAEQALVSSLSHLNYTITPEDYHAIESGAFFPDRAAQFLGAFVASLGLSPTERQDLEDRLEYDILYTRLGERAKDKIQPRAARTA